MTIDLDQVADDNLLDSQGRRPGEEGYNQTKVSQANDKELAKDNAEDDEKNENEDGSSAEENNDTELTVLINNEKITLSTDKWGSSLVDKLEGHGIHIQQNGDLIMLSGSGGKGKACGGRLLVNTKGGQLTKTGPTVIERTGSSTSATEGEGSNTTENSSDEQIAHSEVNYGEVEIETLGTHYIRGRDIVIDAVDSLTLKAGTQIVIDTGHLVQNVGQVEQNVGAENKVVDSQSTNEIKEETSQQYDTRASKNVVGTGHVNQKIQGDWKLWVKGIADLQFMGETLSLPLVKNRTAGLMIGVNGKALTGRLNIQAKDLISLDSANKNIELTAGMGIGINAYGATESPAATGQVKIDSLKETIITSWNGISAANASKITVSEGTEVDSKNEVKIKSRTGDVVLEGMKIYLN